MPYRQPIAVGVLLPWRPRCYWRIAVACWTTHPRLPALRTGRYRTGRGDLLVVVMNCSFTSLLDGVDRDAHDAQEGTAPGCGESEHLSDPHPVGLILLGFSSFYREGFEVVLFLQSYRLKLAERRCCMEPIGVALTAASPC